MLGIVVPTRIAATIPAGNAGVAVPAADIGIPVVVIVGVYGDVVIAAPAAVPPSATPGGTHGHSDPKRNRHASRVVARRRIGDRWIWVNGGAVNYRRVIAGNVDYLWAGLLDDDDGLVLYNFCLHFHLLIGF
jgi:hypothetical protein